MRKPSFFICLMLLIIHACDVSAAEKDTTGLRFKLKGFVNSQAFYDSRQIVESREQMVSLYPKKPEYDVNGNDINASGSFNQLSMTTRFRLLIEGPKVLNAKPSAVVESDFTGSSNATNNDLRLREAYVSLSWTHWTLLMGQTWHPINTPECRPTTVGLNTGAPFHPFSRHNQVRLDYHVGHLKLTAVAASQRDYASDGPIGVSSTYLRNAILPNLHLQAQMKTGGWLGGIGFDYKLLEPEQFHQFGAIRAKSTSRVNSMAVVGYGKYTQGHFSLKGAATLGQNLTEHILLGGYVEHQIDSVQYRLKYAPSNVLACWIQGEAAYGKFQFSLFTGYSSNLGYQNEMAGRFFGRANDIAFLYRIMPRVQFQSGHFTIGTELEYTAAAYGNPDLKGHFTSSSVVGSYRLLAGVFYFF